MKYYKINTYGCQMNVHESEKLAGMLEEFGYTPSPKWNEGRGCIIQSVCLNNKENLIKFCRQIQAVSPVEAFVTPEPWAMPGYTDEVIMAAGTFIQGASIELSGDAPIREPYMFYMHRIKSSAQNSYSFHSNIIAYF